MSRWKKSFITTLLPVAVFLFVCPVLSASDWKAGVARATITPVSSIWLSGYASRDKPSEGKLHDLFAKALALEDTDGHRVVLITTDVIGLTTTICDRVANRVKEKTGLERSALMFTASHTHSGPVLRSNLESMYDLSSEQWDRVTAYTRFLEDKLVEIICDSVNRLQPARIYRGCGTAGFAMNRREYTLEGVRIGVNPIGPVDRDVPVMKVEDESGSLQAIVFGYACHNTTLSVFEINGDYAGFAQAYLEERWPETSAMFFIGCGADANPHPRREIAHAKAHGRELSVAVENVLRGWMKEVKGGLQMLFRTVDLPLVAAPSREELEKQLADPNVYIQRRAKSLIAKLDAEGKLPESYPYSIQVWGFGDDLVWIALAGEVVVDYSLLFKHLNGKDRTWVTGYANDVFAYIPSLRVLREGGYEAFDSMIYYGLYGPWKPEVESRIVETVQTMIREMQM